MRPSYFLYKLSLPISIKTLNNTQLTTRLLQYSSTMSKSAKQKTTVTYYDDCREIKVGWDKSDREIRIQCLRDKPYDAVILLITFAGGDEGLEVWHPYGDEWLAEVEQFDSPFRTGGVAPGKTRDNLMNVWFDHFEFADSYRAQVAYLNDEKRMLVAFTRFSRRKYGSLSRAAGLDLMMSRLSFGHLQRAPWTNIEFAESSSTLLP
jgi:hypothetical protein